MTEIPLNVSKISIPTTLTAAALVVSLLAEQNQLPSEYFSLNQFRLKENVWEDQYLPAYQYDFVSDKIMTIHNLALNLLEESENIPEEFAQVINEDFWEII